MTVTSAEIIENYCQDGFVKLSPDPKTYLDRGMDGSSMNVSFLKAIFAGIKEEIGPDAARGFADMINDMDEVSAFMVLSHLERLEGNDWVYDAAAIQIDRKTLCTQKARQAFAASQGNTTRLYAIGGSTPPGVHRTWVCAMFLVAAHEQGLLTNEPRIAHAPSAVTRRPAA